MLDGLEPIQYENLYHEDDTPLVDVRTNVLRVAVYLGALLLVGFILLGAFIEIPRHIDVPFELQGNTREHVVQFFDPVYLEQKLVQAGATVREGDPLVRLSSPEIVEQLASLESAESRLAIFDATEQQAFRQQIAAVELEMDKVEAVRDALATQRATEQRRYEEERRTLVFQSVRAQERLDRERGLLEKDLTSAEAVRVLEEASVVANSAVATRDRQHQALLTDLDTRARETDLERAVLASRRLELEQTAASGRAVLSGEQRTAADMLVRTFGPSRIEGNGLVLLAPFDGIVSFLTNAVRDVEAGGIVLKMLRNQSQTYATASIPPQRIGQVAVGDPVVLKLATFPHYEWGVLRGTISHLSVTPDEEGLYPFAVVLHDMGNLGDLAQVGMSGELSVEVERRSFFGYLFKTIRQGYFELTR